MSLLTEIGSSAEQQTGKFLVCIIFTAALNSATLSLINILNVNRCYLLLTTVSLYALIL